LKRCFAILLFVLSLPVLRAQVVSDVSFTLRNDSLAIRYTLDRRADICVRVSVGGGRYTEPLNGLTGAVGKGVEPGTGLTIEAIRLSEIRGVDSADLSFLVEVDDGALLVYVDTLVFRMLPVEGGSFVMGCTHPHGERHTYADELPTNKVTVNTFYMGQHEVTQGLWKAVMGENPSKFTGSDSLPVEQVSWDEAQQFCALLSQMTGRRFRLPTEAEWEYAARGGQYAKETVFAGTAAMANAGWYCVNSEGHTHVVGRQQANELGLYDMSGNVSEWVSDEWDEAYYTDTPISWRTVRGGSWFDQKEECRVSSRDGEGEESSFDSIGFRLALEVQ
jgi:hypothetical protein